MTQKLPLLYIPLSDLTALLGFTSPKFRPSGEETFLGSREENFTGFFPIICYNRTYSVYTWHRFPYFCRVLWKIINLWCSQAKKPYIHQLELSFTHDTLVNMARQLLMHNMLTHDDKRTGGCRQLAKHVCRHAGWQTNIYAAQLLHQALLCQQPRFA